MSNLQQAFKNRFIFTEKKNIQEKLKKNVDSPGTITFANVGAAVHIAIETEVAQKAQVKYMARAFALITGPKSANPIISTDIPIIFKTYQEELRGYKNQPN